MFYKLFFNSVDEAQEFIERMNGLGYEWHPCVMDEGSRPCLRFECSKAVYEEIRNAYWGE